MMRMQAEPAFDGKAFVAHLSTAPGVYRMFAGNDDLLYVGKAGNLKKRVGSYFLKPSMQPRIAAMVAQIARIEITLTRTEFESIADTFRDPRVWVRNEYGQWIKDNIWDHN